MDWCRTLFSTFGLTCFPANFPFAHTEERLLGSKSRSGSASGHRWSSLLTRGTNHSSGSGGGVGSGISGGNNASSNNNNNNSHLANNNNTLMVKSLNLPKDDSNLVYRRKSSGSTPHHHQASHHHHHAHHQQHLQQQHAHLQHMQHLGDSSLFQLSDDFECHADGSLLLRWVFCGLMSISLIIFISFLNRIS